MPVLAGSEEAAAGDELAAAALAYARAGLPVLPLHGIRAGACTCGRVDCTSAGKHPRTLQGLTDATTDAELVKSWWTRWPGSNVGIRTGAASGLVVLDIDVATGGAGTLVKLERERGKLPRTAEVLTGSGGRHHWFRHPGGELRNSAGRVGPGVDVRGDGGFVVAPPSEHASGRPYKWLRSLERTPPAELPAWLLDASARRNGSAPAVVELIAEGSRNAELASLAGTMRRRGLSAGEILPALSAVNAARCRPPLPQHEVERIAESVARYAPERASAPLTATAPAAAGGESPAPRILVESWREFEGKAEEHVPHLVEGLWPEAALGFVSAPAKSGKTWIALALALSVTSGRPFADRFEVPRAAPVLYVALEGARSALRARVGALARGLDVDPANGLEGLAFVYKPLGLDLSESTWATELAARADELGAALVVIDVLRAAASFKENDAAEFAALARNLMPLTSTGCSVALLHHFGKLSELSRERQPGERMSGSGAMFGALDAGLFITAYDRTSRRLRVEVTRRDGAEPEPFGLRLAGEGSGEYGGFTYADSAALVHEEDMPAERELKAPASAIREYVLARGGQATPGEILEHFGVAEGTLRGRRPALQEIGVDYVKQGSGSVYLADAFAPQPQSPQHCGAEQLRGANPHSSTGSAPQPQSPATEQLRVTENTDLQGVPQPADPHSLKGDAPPLRGSVSRAEGVEVEERDSEGAAPSEILGLGTPKTMRARGGA